MPLFIDNFANKLHIYNECDVFQESYGRSAYNWPDHWGHWFPTEQPLLQVGRTHRCLSFLIVILLSSCLIINYC